MSKEFQFVYLEDDEAAKLLEAFRLYGTKRGSYTAHDLDLIDAMTDMRKSFYITRAYEYPGWEGKPHTVEYALSCGEKLALVQCKMWLTWEKSEISELEIVAVHGECTFTEQQIRWMITVYHDVARDLHIALQQKLKEDHPEKRWESWELERKRRLMLQNREAWAFDLLSKDYSFHIIDRALQTVLWNCICQYGNNFNKHRDAILGYAMTDAQQRFRLTLCFFLSDGIKRMNEPDDYEFAIVTEKTAGVVYVWGPGSGPGQTEIKEIKGEIPLTEQEICEAVGFYRLFHYDWEKNYEKMYGSIPKRPDDLQTEMIKDGNIVTL